MEKRTFTNLFLLSKAVSLGMPLNAESGPFALTAALLPAEQKVLF